MRKKNNNSLIQKIQKAIREEHLDGWLFCNFRHRDTLADEILGLSKGLSNSRCWFYAVPSSGTPLALVHVIEADILDGLPGTKQTYMGRDDLRERLALLAGKRWAVHMSETISAVSFLDAGVYTLLKGASLELVSAENLIQRFKGVLDKAAAASHERAARALYGIVDTVWDFVRASYHGERSLYEGDLRRVMEDEFTRLDLICDHPPLVAAGLNSANPHYDFTGRGSPIREGDIVQLDLWAKERVSVETVPAGTACDVGIDAGIYADISWVGVYGGAASREAEHVFADLVDVREKTLEYLASAFSAEQRLSGAALDTYCRSLLRAGGYDKAIKHRTGHGIDTEVHGSGVNIDSVEFPDNRHILEGSCFSLEPGIYLADYGFRTEVNVYIKDGRSVISGPGGQSPPGEYSGFPAHREGAVPVSRASFGRQFTLLHC